MILAGVGARHHVPDVEGCLSIKTVVHGSAIWQAGSRQFNLVEDQYLILNDRRRYTITIDSVERVRTFCLFFERGFVEDVFRATVTDSATLLDEPQSELALHFFEKLEMGANPVVAALADLRSANDRCLSRAGRDEHFRRVAEVLIHEHQNAAAAVAKVPALRASTRLEVYRRLLRGRDFLLSSLGVGARLKDALRLPAFPPTISTVPSPASSARLHTPVRSAIVWTGPRSCSRAAAAASPKSAWIPASRVPPPSARSSVDASVFPPAKFARFDKNSVPQTLRLIMRR